MCFNFSFLFFKPKQNRDNIRIHLHLNAVNACSVVAGALLCVIGSLARGSEWMSVCVWWRVARRGARTAFRMLRHFLTSVEVKFSSGS